MARSSRSRRTRAGAGESISLPSPDDGAGDAADNDDASIRRALKSFVFEVSAGRPKGVADATDLQIRIDLPNGRPSRLRAPRRRFRKPAPSPEAQDSAATGDANDGTLPRTPPEATANGGRASSSQRQDTEATSNDGRLSERSPLVNRLRVKPRFNRRRKGLPAGIASIGFNSLIVIVLLAGKLPGVPPLDELLWATAPSVEEIEFTDVDFDATEEDPPIDGDDPTDELIDPGQASFGEFETAAALVEVGGEPTLPAGSLGGDLGALFGESGAGLTEMDSGLGDAPTAKFFGQKIEGRRIVFVLDNSGSMQDGRLETVNAELLRCVESLEDDQEFYVIFHSDTIYPLFYPDPVDRYIRPTDANKRMLARWLDTVELCLGDSVDDALAAAAMIDPDAVFLLSDGRIQGNKKIRFLLDGQSRNFPIHTFAVGMGSSVAGRRNLADIAAANGGEFREGEIPAEMRELARQRLRPYHSERPGPVWGRQVKPFRPRG